MNDNTNHVVLATREELEAMEPDFVRICEVRASGKVLRVHTMPMTNRQNMAEHQWGVASLIMLLHPNPSGPLVFMALHHDFPEAMTGDIPAQAQWQFPALKAAKDLAEEQIRARYDMGVTLTPQELDWLKGCDYLELLMTALDEMMMGNKNFRLVFDRVVAKMGREMNRWPDPVRVMVDMILQVAVNAGLINRSATKNFVHTVEETDDVHN